jgi:phage recombination protein Bet
MVETKEAPQLALSAAEKKLLREKNAKLTDVEFESFMGACQRYRLNPLANQIYARLQPATDRNPRAVTYTAQIDGYRLIADRTGCYAGNDDPIYDNEDNPKRATVKVYKIVDGQRCPFEASARWSQYCPANEKQAFMWRRMPHLMLGKCAEALALRKAFPAELSGLYTDAEMEQAGEENDNPFGTPSEKPKPAAKAPPKEPAKKVTPTEALHACKTPKECAAKLNSWIKDRPVVDNLASWKGIYALAFALLNTRVSDGAWKETGELEQVLEGIKKSLELAEQGAEAFSLNR